MDPISPLSRPEPRAVTSQAQDPLRAAAVALEATFLAEMLKVAGFGQTRSEFGGGIGEDQFQSFLVDAQAKALAEAGGIGLSETIFRALQERENG